MITTIQNCVLISVFIFHTHMHLFKKSFIIKLYTLFTLLVSISSKTVNYGEPLETDKLIKIINRNKASWKAGRNFHSSIKKHHVRSLMGLKTFSSHTCLPKKISLEKFGTPEVPIPDSFDARKKWPFCKSLQNLTDQGNCGSCWAVSSTSTFSDRMCIASKGKFNKILSAEELISCCTTCGEGCFGGYDDHAWKHLKIEGIVTGGDYGSNEGCQPYTMKPCEHTPEGPLPHCKDIGKMKTPQCQRQCINNLYKIPYDEDHHRAKEIYYLSDVEEIQRDIITYGPIQTGYTVYEDFLSYKNGVYHHVSGDKIGLHAVKVIGWGSENNVPYWLVQNSWNEYWGDKGYFKIIRGNNECGFESRMYAGYPLV